MTALGSRQGISPSDSCVRYRSSDAKSRPSACGPIAVIRRLPATDRCLGERYTLPAAKSCQLLFHFCGDICGVSGETDT